MRTATHTGGALDVVENELQNDTFSNLVLAGGHKDVTSLYTKGKVDIQHLREVAIFTAQQTVRLAEAAVQEYPALNSVVIVRSSPRFDLDSDDPLHLKPQLAQLMDSVLFGLWGKSQFKEKKKQLRTKNSLHSNQNNNKNNKSY